jgi:hypothetical protein
MLLRLTVISILRLLYKPPQKCPPCPPPQKCVAYTPKQTLVVAGFYDSPHPYLGALIKYKQIYEKLRLPPPRQIKTRAFSRPILYIK